MRKFIHRKYFLHKFKYCDSLAPFQRGRMTACIYYVRVKHDRLLKNRFSTLNNFIIFRSAQHFSNVFEVSSSGETRNFRGIKVLRDILKRISKSPFSWAPHTHATPVGYSVAPQRNQARVVFSKLVFLPGAHNYWLPFLRCSLNVCTCRLKDRKPWWQARYDSSNFIFHSIDWYFSLPRFSSYQITSILEFFNFKIFLFMTRSF